LESLNLNDMNTQKLVDLKKFVQKEIIPATSDLGKLDDPSRKHLQKLVYTNLVDRFDSMIDGAILDNCREEYLVDEAAKSLTQPVTESDLIRLLMYSENIQVALDTKLTNSLRNSILRERHSKKLCTLFRVFKPQEDAWNRPRVNIADGAIFDKITPQQKNMPYSVCGYADWLYSRRNSIVHGAGTNRFLNNDLTQLKKLFKCTPSSTFRIKLSSITNAAAFYQAVIRTLDG
jgi:hypothetical protein